MVLALALGQVDIVEENGTIIGSLTPGAFVGEMSLFRGGTRFCDLVGRGSGALAALLFWIKDKQNITLRELVSCVTEAREERRGARAASRRRRCGHCGLSTLAGGDGCLRDWLFDLKLIHYSASRYGRSRVLQQGAASCALRRSHSVTLSWAPRGRAIDSSSGAVQPSRCT